MNEYLLNLILKEIKKTNENQLRAVGFSNDKNEFLRILEKYELEDDCNKLSSIFSFEGYMKIHNYCYGVYLDIK